MTKLEKEYNKKWKTCKIIRKNNKKDLGSED
jgi:hypothetical protein